MLCLRGHISGVTLFATVLLCSYLVLTLWGYIVSCRLSLGTDKKYIGKDSYCNIWFKHNWGVEHLKRGIFALSKENKRENFLVAMAQAWHFPDVSFKSALHQVLRYVIHTEVPIVAEFPNGRHDCI